MKSFVLKIIVFSLMHQSSHAGIFESIFGYENSRECILDKMKGTTSNVAANAIRNACAKYDEIDRSECLNKINIPGIDGNGGLRGFEDFFDATIYNASPIYTITRLDIRIKGKNGETKIDRVVRGDVYINPLNNGDLVLKIGVNSLTNMTWSVEQVYGCKK